MYYISLLHTSGTVCTGCLLMLLSTLQYMLVGNTEQPWLQNFLKQLNWDQCYHSKNTVWVSTAVKTPKPACFVESCNVTVRSNKTLQLDQWLTRGSHSLCDAGRPLVWGRRLQVCRMLKSVVGSFRLDSVPLTAVSILRDLGVTSLIIIGDLRPVNCATA
jgi:hypothetical protein